VISTLPGFERVNSRRQELLVRKFVGDSDWTPEDERELQRAQRWTNWLMLPLRVRERIAMWRAMRRLRRMNRRIQRSARKLRRRLPEK